MFKYTCPMCRKEQRLVVVRDLEHGDLYKVRRYDLVLESFKGDSKIELMETDLVIRQFECPTCQMIIQGDVEEKIRKEYERWN